MLKKSRLFIFGDSWAENLYRRPEWVEANMSPLPMPGIPYHLDDYLRHNYDVYNYAQGGSANVEIVYQFSHLPVYEPGDRILIIWSHFIRHSLWNEDGNILNYGDFNLPFEKVSKSPFKAPKEVYSSLHGRLKQLVMAEETPIDEIPIEKVKEEFKFYNWLPSILGPWKPIVTTWEPTLAKILGIVPIHYGADFFKKEKITIKEEYGLKDGHLSGRGNYLLYKFLLNLLDETAQPMEQVYRVEEPKKEVPKNERPKVLH